MIPMGYKQFLSYLMDNIKLFPYLKLSGLFPQPPSYTDNHINWAFLVMIISMEIVKCCY